MTFSCMSVTMDSRCDCVEPVLGGHIGGYDYCSNCNHTLAAHGVRKSERTAADPRANAAQSLAQARTDAQADNSKPVKVEAVKTDPTPVESASGELSSSEIRKIARENGIAVGERGRIHPDVIAAVYALAGQSAPVTKTVKAAAKPSATGLDIKRLRARLVKIGKAGSRGRLSPDQIALAQTLED